MLKTRTFAMIKPDLVANNLIGEILDKIEKSGFKIVDIKKKKMSDKELLELYQEHVGKAFFPSLKEYIQSGDVVVMVLESEEAIEKFRNLIGHTDPLKANIGTLRQMYCKSIDNNGFHGSDSPTASAREISIFF